MSTAKIENNRSFDFGKSAGIVLGLLFLVIYLLHPSKEHTLDAGGWGEYLDLYAEAPGNMLFATGGGEEIKAYELADVDGSLERWQNPGWWALFNPHHLLFLPFAATEYRIVSAYFHDLSGIQYLQIKNSIFSALTLYLIYTLLYSIIPRSLMILPWCLFLGMSVTYFNFSTDGSQYPNAVFLLTVASLYRWKFMQEGKQVYLNKFAVWLGIAMLFHQIIAIVAFFLLASLFLKSGIEKNVQNKGQIVGAWMIATGIPALVYLLVAVLSLTPTGEFTPSGLVKYLTLYAQEREYWSYSILDGLWSNFVSVIGFYFGNLRTATQLFYDKLFSLFSMILVAYWLTTLFALKQMDQLTRRWIMVCLMWAVPLLIFLSFWVPWFEYYQLFLVVPFSCLAVIGPEKVRRSGREGWIDTAIFWTWCLCGIWTNLGEIMSGRNIITQ